MELPACRYGSGCYRKNPQHFLEFFHPTDVEQTPNALDADIAVVSTTTTTIVERSVDNNNVNDERECDDGGGDVIILQEESSVKVQVKEGATNVTVTETARIVSVKETAAKETAVVSVKEREVIVVDETNDADDGQGLPPLVPLLRQLSVSAKSGLLGSEERAHLKDLLLSGNRELVLSAAMILDTLGPPPSDFISSLVPMPSSSPSSSPSIPSTPLVPASFHISPTKTEAKTSTGFVMYILRGISGSGKSTLSTKLTTQPDGSRVGMVCSTDDFFMDATGIYQFDGSRLHEAHTWNQQRAKNALKDKISPVVIDNTHTQCWEAQPYVLLAVKFGYDVKVQEPDTWWAKDAKELAKRNQHGVPLEAIQRMLDRWENDFSVQAILAAKPPGRKKPQGSDNRGRPNPSSGTPNSRSYQRDKTQTKVALEHQLQSKTQKLNTEQEAVEEFRFQNDLNQEKEEEWQQVPKRSHGKR